MKKPTLEEYVKEIWESFLLNVSMGNNAESLVRAIDTKAPFKVPNYKVVPIDEMHTKIVLDLQDGEFTMIVKFRRSVFKKEIYGYVVDGIE